LLGREVATLIDEEKSPGNYEITFDTGHSEQGRGMTSGIYFIANSWRSSLHSGHVYIQTRKMILLK